MFSREIKSNTTYSRLRSVLCFPGLSKELDVLVFVNIKVNWKTMHIQLKLFNYLYGVYFTTFFVA